MRSLLLLILLFPGTIIAQDRCGVNASYFSRHPESIKKFENWLSKKVELKANLLRTDALQEEEIYQIPVVFHIIHRGEPVGLGVNLTEEKILEQLSILNEDFRRLNADTVNTPEEFLPVAADTKIEFVMAKRDPEGLPTNGIVRKQGSLESYRYSDIQSQSDELILKAESYWPAEQYLNFWITDLTAPTLGYSSFPFSNLEGINEIWNNEFRDGVVVDYKFIGLNDDTGTFNSFGRTATHELGHFLGLKHVNGDGGCSVDDFCEDTPNQNTLYGGQCPSSSRISCDNSDMYSNYLNYTDDACMNIFSEDQKERMRIVLENSPRRTSLLNSPALQNPVVVAKDMGVRQILSPDNDECLSEVSPAIEVRNYGSDTVNSFSILMRLNNILLETVTRAIELPPLATAVVNFNNVFIDPSGTNEFSFSVNSVDGEADENEENNVRSAIIYPVEEGILPLNLDFESQSNYEVRTASGNSSAWQIVEAPYLTSTNQALTLDFYNDSTRFGEKDYLITPVLDLSALNSAEIIFRYAYAGRTSALNKDGLIVAISTDCGKTFDPQDYVFEEYGIQLSTTAPTDDFFEPLIDTDWKEVNINLTAYAGYDNVKIAFIGQNGLGNALYLDDITITSNSLKAYDLGIRSVKNVSVITCDSIVVPTVEIKNHGFETVSDYSLEYELIGYDQGKDQLNGQLISGDVQGFSKEFTNLAEGTYDLYFNISEPDGNPDEFAENDQFYVHFIVNNVKEDLPLRESFEKESNWVITNHTNDPIWDYTKLGSNTVLKAPGYNETEIGTDHWLISPLLRLDDLDSASVEFRYAYANRNNRKDRLRVLLSVNCGKDFQYTLFDKEGNSLSENTSNDPFIPEEDTTWITTSIDLSEFTVWDEVRVAFVFTNGNGNNLFLDDIEFFTQSSPPELRFEDPFTLFPNPADDFFKLSLNLTEKQDITISLIDLSGKLVFSKDYFNALNQEITFDSPTLGGFYILRATGKNINYSERILIEK